MEKKMLITPNFHFSGGCEEAIQLYEKAFKGKVLLMLRYSDADERDYIYEDKYKNYIYHAEMLLGGNRIMLSDNISHGEITSNQSLSLVVTMDNKEEVQEAYELIKEGGKILQPMKRTTYSSCFVSLVDKFGFRWEIMTEQTDR